jgi:hypothetical protein
LAYVYCDADPVNGIDPSGHTDLGLFFGFLGIAVFVSLVVVLAPVLVPVLVTGAWGVVICAGLGFLGESYGDHLSDGIDQANKECDEYNKAHPYVADQ